MSIEILENGKVIHQEGDLRYYYSNVKAFNDAQFRGSDGSIKYDIGKLTIAEMVVNTRKNKIEKCRFNIAEVADSFYKSSDEKDYILIDDVQKFKAFVKSGSEYEINSTRYRVIDAVKSLDSVKMWVEDSKNTYAVLIDQNILDRHPLKLFK